MNLASVRRRRSRQTWPAHVPSQRPIPTGPARDHRGPGLAGAGAFTPDAVKVGARHLEVGSECVASFAVVGYPREVANGWLQPLLT
jgi:hypothetical protein